ncbi:MAG: SPOR domain-containing protein [Saprospiraceae bacterium]|nr:SPOR domain-containing protein [Saprospiraceae bacterium]
MGRIVKVLLYTLVILIMYFWITAIMRASKKSKEAENIPVVSQDSIADITDETEIYDESERPISNDDIVNGKIPYKEVDKTLDELTTNKKSPETNSNPVQNTTPASKPASQNQDAKKPAIKPEEPKVYTDQTSTEGDYLVMAGSYLLEENANKMAAKLRSLGYSNAGVSIFNASQYYSVIAVRHTTQQKAQLSVDALKRQGVECYVKKKQ